MFKELPAPDDAVLANAPANVVVFAIAFEAERDLRPADGINWQRTLDKHGYSSATLQKVVQRNINVQATIGPGVAAVPSIDSREGWLTVSRTAQSQASIYKNGIMLERIAYSGFTDFCKEIEAACLALNEVLTPSLRSRLSLRYSNALSEADASTASYWSGKIAAPFLSIASDERLSADFQRTLSVLDFADGEQTLQVRSGLQPDAVHEGAIAFVFDIEVANVGLKPFSVDSCLADVRTLNYSARQMFQAIVTPTFFVTLKG
jgi:uncharacterized protein (TIGR04255 family)